MSQISSVGGMGVSAASTTGSSAMISESSSMSGMAISSESTMTSISSSSQMLSASNSSNSAMSPNERLAMLIAVLIELLFGKNGGGEEGGKMLASLLGNSQGSGNYQAFSSSVQSFEFQQTSQVVQMNTCSSAVAVQGTAYGQMASGESAGSGGNINLLA